MVLRKDGKSGGWCRGIANSGGFTLNELIVVVAVIALLALVRLPALGYHKATGRGFGCLNNLRQLTLGWLMYAEDNQGRVVPNLDGQSILTGTNAWVRGSMDYYSNNPDNTNTLNLVDARYTPLGPYTKRPELYRCPEDQSGVRVGGRFYPRVRSYSMSSAMGRQGPDFWLPTPRYRTFQKLSDIVRPAPGQCWVLMDEHPDSINDPCFALAMVEPDNLAPAVIVDYPGSYHQGAVGISFADGHMEFHRWTDRRTMPAMRFGGLLPLNVPSPNNRDVLWLSQRTTSKAR
ncbi:MAG: type II secretion system protein [Verrucomicrobiota bacterium]